MHRSSACLFTAQKKKRLRLWIAPQDPAVVVVDPCPRQHHISASSTQGQFRARIAPH
jgi:hypothetical protein